MNFVDIRAARDVKCRGWKGHGMMYKLLVVAILFPSVSADAACIFGGGTAGQNPAYHYAVDYINSTIAAETGLKRFSNVAEGLKPAVDYQSAFASFSGALKEYELAARDVECAASIIQR
jgi:hypothetical protein